MRIIDQYRFESNTIFVTMTPTNGFVAGIYVVFASGTVTVDWKDGTIENFTSGVEKTHIYDTAGTYVTEISGSILNITKFRADTCNISKLENFKTGLLTDLQLFSNYLTGELDLSLAPVSGAFYVYSNSDLTSIKFATTGNAKITDFRAYACKLTGTLNLANVPIGTQFSVYGNSLLTGITFATSGNSVVTSGSVRQCNLTGVLDLSAVPIGGAGSYFYFYSNPLLTGITFADSGNGIFSDIRAYSCALDYISFTKAGISLSANNCSIRIEGNGMAAGDVNHILVNLLSLVFEEIIGGDYTGRVINIGGSNADPDTSSGGYNGVSARTTLQSLGFTVTIT